MAKSEPPQRPETRAPSIPRANAPDDRARAWLVGDVLADRFRVGSLLGRGGMGEVFEAHDLELDVPVALKRLRPGIADGPEALQRLKREVLLARSVSHPAVCRLHDVFRHREGRGDAAFLVMELLRGTTLAEEILARGRIPTDEALPVVRQVAAALAAIHRAGAVHRDVKSGNVMLVQSDGQGAPRAVLTDFGLAGSALECDPDTFGTPPYMAPEQALGAVGPAADVHGIGAMLYEMLTGRLPFPSRTPRGLVGGEADEDLVPPRSMVPDLPPSWEDAILRCLRRDPDERFTRMEDLVAALEGDASPRVPVTMRLPAERDAFVGRSAEIAELERAFTAGARLVTVAGPPGVGKTRLAVRFASASVDAFPGGAWSCDLSLARGRDGMVAALAVALDVPLHGHDVEQRVGHALASRGRALVLLDRFEHLREHAAATLGAWSDRASEIRFLATSRERLGLPGEHVLSLDALDEEDALALFLARAEDARPGMARALATDASLHEILRLLDGHPLAIELAAARLGTLKPQELRARLEEQLRVLVGDRKAGAHASLAACIDDSWQALAPWERAVLAQASVFEGGMALDALEATADVAPWHEAPPMVDVIRALVDKSLLRLGRVNDAARLNMLASIQAFAAGRLADADPADMQRAAEARHGSFFASSARREDRTRARWLSLERANLVAACRRAVVRDDSSLAARTCAAACEAHAIEGPAAAGRDLADSVLAMPRLERGDRALVMVAAGPLQRLASLDAAIPWQEKAAALAREVGDARLEGRALAGLARALGPAGRWADAEAPARRALEIATACGDALAIGIAHGTLAEIAEWQGRGDDASAHFRAVIEVAARVGDAATEALTRVRLTAFEWHSGRIAEPDAHAEIERALDRARRARGRQAEAMAHGLAGRIHQDQRRLADAREQYGLGLVVARGAGIRSMEGRFVGSIASLDAMEGRNDAAFAGFAQAAEMLGDIGDHHSEAGWWRSASLLAHQCGRQDDAQAALDRALALDHCGGTCYGHAECLHQLANFRMMDGRLEDARDALRQAEPVLRRSGFRRELAQMLASRGLVEAASGDHACARETLAEADAIAAELGDAVSVNAQTAIARLRAALQGDGAS